MTTASRREFVRWATASGIAVGVSRLALAEPLEFLARETLPGRDEPRAAALARGRIDGIAKVTGAKLYASDFRAADLPGWPAQTSHALLVRSPDAERVYEGIDLEALAPAARPTVVVTSDDLRRIGVRVPGFYAGDLLCPPGTTPQYLGQPVTLLLFDSFDAFDMARLALRQRSLLRFGASTGPLAAGTYGAWRFTRVAGATPDAPDVYSPLQEGWISPGVFDSGGRPVWTLLPISEGAAYAKGAAYGEAIRASLKDPDPGVLALERTFETASVDPVFLEPECALGWYSTGQRTLELVLGVQSPFEAGQSVAELLGAAETAYRPERIHAQFAYVGGGFGGRDHTPFPLYAALAAMFLPDRPVRLAHDRFEQFQGGVKRHAFRIRSHLGVDRASGRMTSFAADHVLDGGGLANYSASVAIVGATGAIGMYDIPRVDVTTVAERTRGVPAGSMRGYGTLQTMAALEVLVDEAAAALAIDPITFRRRNALRTGHRTMTGNPYTVTVRAQEILDRLEGHVLWRERAAWKTGAGAGHVTGTGVACVSKDYGTGADCSLGSVRIDAEGRVTIHGDHVEMGNGIGTALANRVAAHLGAVADEVTVAQVDAFGPLALTTSDDPYSITQAAQDEAARDPRWVPAISTATSASIGAHVGTQAAAEAARAVFRFGLWPAALALWGIGPDDPRSMQSSEAFWQDGQLLLSGLMPLALPAVAARAHAMNAVTGAMAHAFSRWAWAEATFVVDGETWTGAIDALAVCRGSGDFVRLERRAVAFPPTDYNRIGTAFSSMCGTIVRIEIGRATGTLRIAGAYSVLECGQALVPDIVLGQAQGGFAMGVGHALMESLPPFEDGPGNGRWTLGRYRVARGSDLPLRELEIEVLPPASPKEGPKGMAEVVMIPVIPALLNAIADATGHRFASLPVTTDMLKDVLA